MEEAYGVVDEIHAQLIPELCEALHRERPRLKERIIKNQVARDIMDTYPGIVNDRYLHAWTIPNRQTNYK